MRTNSVTDVRLKQRFADVRKVQPRGDAKDKRKEITNTGCN